MKQKRILRRKKERRALRTVGLVTLIIGAVAALGALLVRDQISQPRAPDGRVDFDDELLTAEGVAEFGDLPTLSYRRT